MQERAKRTRSQILSAAAKLFSSYGLSGARVDEIAEIAQVNKQRIYAYFGSKNQLFEAVLLDVFEHVELFSQKMVDAAKRHPERLTEIVLDGFLKVHAAHPDFWRLLAWANLDGSQCPDALNHMRKKEYEQLRKLYSRAVSDGLLRPIRFEIWLFSLLAVSYFRYSNILTLSHTLGWSDPVPQFEKELSQGLNQLFTMKEKKHVVARCTGSQDR